GDVEHPLERRLADPELTSVEREQGQTVKRADGDARRAYVRQPGREADLHVDRLEGGVDLQERVGADRGAGDDDGGNAGLLRQTRDVVDGAHHRQVVDGSDGKRT